MAARGRRGGPSLRSQDGGGENQGVEHHVQGDGAPDGAAVVVAPGQGQGHGHILEEQQQVAEIHRAVGIDELPDAVKGKNQGGMEASSCFSSSESKAG